MTKYPNHKYDKYIEIVYRTNGSVEVLEHLPGNYYHSDKRKNSDIVNKIHERYLELLKIYEKINTKKDTKFLKQNYKNIFNITIENDLYVVEKDISCIYNQEYSNLFTDNITNVINEEYQKLLSKYERINKSIINKKDKLKLDIQYPNHKYDKYIEIVYRTNGPVEVLEHIPSDYFYNDYNGDHKREIEYIHKRYSEVYNYYTKHPEKIIQENIDSNTQSNTKDSEQNHKILSQDASDMFRIATIASFIMHALLYPVLFICCFAVEPIAVSFGAKLSYLLIFGFPILFPLHLIIGALFLPLLWYFILIYNRYTLLDAHGKEDTLNTYIWSLLFTAGIGLLMGSNKKKK